MQRVSRFQSSQTKLKNSNADMRDDFRFEIQLADRVGNPVAKEVLIDIVLFLRQRVRYRFNLGTTDGSGLIKIDFQRLEEIRRSNQKDNLMDYNTPLTECDSIVEILVPSSGELKQRLEAVRKWFADDSVADVIAKAKNDEVTCDPLRVDVEAKAGERLLLRCD